MGIIDKITGVAALKQQIKALQSILPLAHYSSISTHIFPSWHIFKELETYRIVDEVSSVVKYLANVSAMLPIYGYAKGTREDLPEGNKLVDFLDNLSYDQKYILFLFLYLCDEVFIFKETLEFGPNAGVVNIHFLHPNNTTLVLSEGFPSQTLGYIFRDTARGTELPFTPEEIIFIKGFNPTVDPQAQHRGQSAISLLCQTLTRLKSGKDGSVAQLQNGGTPGVLFEKNAGDGAFEAIEKKGMRDTKLAAFLSNQDNKGAPYTAVGDLGWIAMGLPLADMQVAELAKIDKDAIYNAYSVSNRLFNNDATGSEISDKSAHKSLYLNAVMPKTKRVQDAFNKYLVPDFKIKAFVEFDFSDIEVLQENMLEKANALAASPVMVPNDVREAMGYDRSTNPLMDLEYVKTGYQPIDDFNAIEPIE